MKTAPKAGPLSLLSIPKTAERLDCSTKHVYRLITAGVLRAVDEATPGAGRSKTRVRSDDIDHYIKTHTRRAVSASRSGGQAA